jgi:4-amino-4-deoxy-L-arabinose transferase-like glycosyltransferase
MAQSTLVNYYVLLALFIVAWTTGGYWLYVDSKARGSSYPSLWAISWIVFWPIGVYYLIYFYRGSSRESPPSRTEHIAAVFAASSLIATSIGLIPASTVEITRAGTAVLTFAVVIPVMYYLIIYRRNSFLQQSR